MALGFGDVAFDQSFQFGLPMRGGNALPAEGFRVEPQFELLGVVVDEGDAAGEAGAEVIADRAQHHYRAAGHVFAAIGADAFDHCDGAGVADGEALATFAGSEEFTGGGAVQDGVADDGVLVADQFRGRRRPYHDGGAGQAFADIVIGVAEDFELEPGDREGAERLPGRAVQPHRHMSSAAA